MFKSFFPRPNLFFLSAAVWAIVCVVAWFAVLRGLGDTFSLGGLFGYGYPEALSADADDAAKAAFETARESAVGFWYYQVSVACFVAFLVFWMRYAPHPWAVWSVIGSTAIVFSTWLQVQLDLMINRWFGDFYNLLQKALSEPNVVSEGELYYLLGVFISIAMVWVAVYVMTKFLISHYVFRWRTAINDYYMSLWSRIRHIEGASQRVQEDAKRFAAIVEGLGVYIIDSAMTLIAFLPVLWGLSSSFVKVIPVFGEIPQPLVFIAIVWSAFGTALLAIVGIRLPGLEFRNQRVEAAYRKELVLGEDDPNRAQPPTVGELFDNVRRNYFRLFINYLYFNIARRGYAQLSVIVVYVALVPTIAAAGFTLGVMQQISRAFDRVQSSFQFLVNSWETIVELLSIYKRLKAFERAIAEQPLDDIEHEPAVAPAE